MLSPFLELPLTAKLRVNLEKARKKAEEKREKSNAKRKAAREEEKRQRAEKRRRDPNAKPCPSCGNWDHERSSSADCPNGKLKKRDQAREAGLTRRSTVKTTLDSICNNEILISVIKATVLRCRNLRHTASLFVNYLTARRLQSGEPMPSFTQTFFYNVFCQLISRGQGADTWIKDLYSEFQTLLPTNRTFSFHHDTSMITDMAREYTTASREHVCSNFKKRTLDYFFLRLNDDSDAWYLATASVQERRAIATYIYQLAAGLQAQWPEIENTSISRAMINVRTFTLQLGPTPITETSLAAHAKLYMPWLHSVLTYMERRVLVREPVSQKYASKQYIHRNMEEVSCGIEDSFNDYIFVDSIYRY